MRILEGGLFFEGRVFIAEALEFSFQVFADVAFSGSYLFALTLYRSTAATPSGA